MAVTVEGSCSKAGNIVQDLLKMNSSTNLTLSAVIQETESML